jgi:hypothetical protein
MDKESATLESTGWDSPNDAENPLNWSSYKRNLHIAIVSLLTLNA